MRTAPRLRGTGDKPDLPEAVKAAHRPSTLRAGDLVEILSPEEILETLDEHGTLDALPFMPEMLPFCGKRYRISTRVLQAVIDGAGLRMEGRSHVRRFKNDDVFILERLRCSGVQHDGCQRGCTLFWKEAWLRTIQSEPSGRSRPEEAHALPHLTQSPLGSARATHGRDPLRLKTRTEGGAYFCQSSEFPRATEDLSSRERIANCVRAVHNGNDTALQMVRQLAVWLWWRVWHRLYGPYPRGNCKPTPTGALELQPGDWVEVKSLREITDTLDKHGRNRGLHFSPDMRLCCGQRYRVLGRADKLIIEGTGQMRGIPNTVILEGAICDSACYAFGGCPRADFLYWREIWLRRVPYQPLR